MKYIYGPVRSRRLGLSLGLSLTPFKVCSFDCVYCQWGGTTRAEAARREYVPLQEILDEFSQWGAQHPDQLRELSFITFSGYGEPTLHSGIADLVQGLRKLSSVPLALITNSSMLVDPRVREAVLGFDLIVPSLDAADQEVFERIDRPYPGIKVQDILSALEALRREFKGKIWLEVMLVKGINDSPAHLEKLAAAIARIGPDKVQLNSPVRATAVEGVCGVDAKTLERMKALIGPKCESY
jgi:wyosine [tRNA(Phe)-imidazoG37] synthetase (radical SAM superfamily)